MKRPWVLAAAVLQFLALGYLAGEREWILHLGRTVWLRTAPLDPRDVMRGDYVRLEYEAARVPRALWRGGLTNSPQNPEARFPQTLVYAGLQVGPDGLAEVVSLSDVKPREGLFLRGRLDSGIGWSDARRVRFGLEAYFMEQGRAQELEDERRTGVPLRMEVAVSRNGVGVLKGYRWEALGLSVAFDSVRKTNHLAGFPQVQTVVIGATVELKNHSPEPVAIVALPNDESFGLVCDARWQEPGYRWIGEGGKQVVPRESDVTVLQSGQSRSQHFDLRQARWAVVDVRTNALGSVARPLQELPPDWNNGFRFEYRPPDAAVCRDLPHAALIWHGRLRSRWFGVTGNVD